MHQRHHLGGVLVVLLATLALGGCTSPTGERGRIPKLTDLTGAVTDLFRSKPRSETTPTAAALYKDGIDYFERGRYARSISFFQKLRDEYPFSKEAEDAELKIADAYSRNEEYALAEETYKNYLTFQPTGQHAHFVKYQLGRVNLAQFTGVDRDLEKVREARRQFESVIRDHPDSEHVPDARQRLAETRVHLAERELYIGNHYLEDQRYRAARERFEKVVREYSDTPAASAARDSLIRLPQAGQDEGASPASPGGDTATKAVEPMRFIVKEGYDYEATTQRSWYTWLNPFSWRRDTQASTGAGQRASAGAERPPAGNAPPREERKGFFQRLFSFLNPFSWSREKPDPPAAAAAVDAGSAKDVVESIDATLGTAGTSPDDAPKPPVAALPPEKNDPAPKESDPAEVLGAVDRQLGEATAPADAPQAPAADPGLFSAEQAQPAERAPDKPQSGLLEGIDRALGSDGTGSPGELPPPPASP